MVLNYILVECPCRFTLPIPDSDSGDDALGKGMRKYERVVLSLFLKRIRVSLTLEQAKIY